jgi:hypothetical protein
MSLQRHFRSGDHGLVLIRAVLVSIVLLGILAARNVPSQFLDATGAHYTISADSHHDQRPRFDNNASHWSAPAANFALFLPTAKSADVKTTPKLFRTLQSKGFHFNRPPPIS